MRAGPRRNRGLEVPAANKHALAREILLAATSVRLAFVPQGEQDRKLRKHVARSSVYKTNKEKQETT